MAPRAPLVLVVDDDLDILGVLTQYLENDGFRVVTATDGWQAAIHAESLKIDLIVCDIMMPGPQGSGFDAYQKIRTSHSPRRGVPIVFVTAAAKDKTLAALPKDERTRVLFKPVSPDTLRQAIRELLGR